MAKDGQEAIEILEKKWETYQIVLLDLNMPVINGYEVLKVMEEKQWLDSLPVICISAETSEASIGKAYELGATDYFTRPFDTAVVLRRVHNTIALYAKASSSLHDAMEMLSGIFYRIIKINLSTDTYRTLKNISDDFRSPLDGIKSISQRLRQYGEEYVHEEDQECFLEFCDSENLRKNFSEEDTERISMSYRCRNGQEFRWVSMEIIKSTEYAKDNEVVVLYLRDINTDYLKQLDEVMRKTTDSLGTVTVNVSKGKCISCAVKTKNIGIRGEKENLDDYVRRISMYVIGCEDRAKANQLFVQENLLKEFAGGRTNLFRLKQFAQGDKDEKIRMFRITIEMIRNSVTDDIEGVLYFQDITESYLAEKIPQLLYQKNFEKVALIDARRNLINMESTEDFNAYRYLHTKIDYNTYCREILGTMVPEQEKEHLKKNTDIEKICRELNQNGRYSFTVHQISEDGEIRLKEFNFMYLFRELGIILAVTEDITELSGTDMLTGGYNRRGFIHNSENIFRHCADRTDYAVLYFNVRNFKAVNELFGIDTGDSVLSTIYKNLRSSSLKPCVVARVEADQFTCLVEKKNLDFDALSGLCEWNFTKKGKTMHIFCGCGIFFVENKEMSINGMIDRAKLAKKYITDEYVKPYNIYDASMKSYYIDRAELAGELRNGLAQEQFKVYYQPVVDAKTGEIRSAEALIRWVHPKRGFVSPAIFIPALEESGHISELDFYVTKKKVFEFMQKRCEDGKKNIPISINLSWMDFYNER